MMTIKKQLLLLCSVVSVLSILWSCTDDEVVKSAQSRGLAVRFEVQDVQQEAIARSRGMVSPGAIVPQLQSSDLSSERLKVTGSAGEDLYMINTAVEGINPMQPAKRTHANVATSIVDKFTSIGYRTATYPVSLDQMPWFHGEETQSNGELVKQVMWDWSKRYAKFFAVSPQVQSSYSKLQLFPATSPHVAPYVDFEVEQDVKQQKDLMTACSGLVKYENELVAPTSRLAFHHALTAVRFAVGSNLSWNKRITKIEIREALSKGRFTLPTDSNTNGTWSGVSTPATFTLDLSSSPVDLKKNPNAYITGDGADNYTFMMIPQSTKDIEVHITLEDNDPAHPSSASNTISVKLPDTGVWKAGTTRTYKLSQNISDWEYVLTASSPAAVAYTATQTGNYGIMSYRQAPDGSRQAVAWKVIGYDADGTGNFSMGEKPDWLTSLSMTSGTGGNFTQNGTASITAAQTTDLLAERNKGLREATPKGSAGNYYNLSNQSDGGATVQNTANCYVISAPGYYRLPLVYGNGIKNGIANVEAYTGPNGNSNPDVLDHFKDHLGNDIDNPWIEQTNSGTNSGVNGAKVVWADETNLVHFDANPIVRNGTQTFLQFEVKANDIKNGNAVVAVTKNGTVVWSWHLWFAPQSALDKIQVTNFLYKDYFFTTENLGWKYTSWNGTSFTSPRSVKVRVEQEVGNGAPRVMKYATITITQNNGAAKVGTNTFYQFGRKDAMPGNGGQKEGSFIENAGNNITIPNSIQNPDRFYILSNNWNPPSSGGAFGYYNMWSAKNAAPLNGVGNDAAVVKTVYDPSPVGFKLPASNAFTGFTENGQNGSGSDINVDGTTDYNVYQSNYGHNFYTDNSKSSTIFFPASGLRNGYDGSFVNAGNIGFYWSAVPFDAGNGSSLNFFWSYAYPLIYCNSSYGFGVRPSSE